MVENENASVGINPNSFIACEKRKSTWWWKWSLQSICTPRSLIQSVHNIKEFPSRYWYFKAFVFLVKEVTLFLLKIGFIKFAEHHAYTRSISDCKGKQSIGELIAR
jgi:hypothetical protein